MSKQYYVFTHYCIISLYLEYFALSIFYLLRLLDCLHCFFNYLFIISRSMQLQMFWQYYCGLFHANDAHWNWRLKREERVCFSGQNKYYPVYSPAENNCFPLPGFMSAALPWLAIAHLFNHFPQYIQNTLHLLCKKFAMYIRAMPMMCQQLDFLLWQWGIQLLSPI